MTLTLVLLAALAAPMAPAAGGSAPARFPRYIQFDFKAMRGAIPVTGTFRLELTDDPTSPANHLLVLKGFSGLGLGNSEILYTAVSKVDLALQYHTVMPYEGAREYSRQVSLESCQSVMESHRSNCFVYREGASPTMQTEIFTPFPGLDVLSSMLVATRFAESADRVADYNFIQGRNAMQVRLVREHAGSADTASGPLPTTTVGVRAANENALLYKIQVSRSPRGSYPSQFEFQSEHGSFAATAKAPVW